MAKQFRRTFSEEERQRYVKEALRTGSNNLVVKKYKLNASLISRWVCNYRRYGQTLKPKDERKKLKEKPIPNYKKEYRRLKKEVEDKNLEIKVLRDLLKKKKKKGI